MRDLPPLPALRSFEAAARLGTMSAAATELGRTHGAVSRQISHLECALGRVLFLRTGSTLKLTLAGEELLCATMLALDTLERCYLDLRGGRPEVVRIGCGSTFASRWLIPRLPRFYARQRGITLQVELLERFAREARGVDIATTWDRLTYPLSKGDHVRVLGDVHFVIAGHPAAPFEVTGSQVTFGTRLRSGTSPGHWNAFALRTGISIRSNASMDFANTQQCVDAAAAGLGFVVVEARLIAPELADGRLAVRGPDWRVPGGFAALLFSRPPLATPLRHVLAWLADEASLGAGDPRSGIEPPRVPQRLPLLRGWSRDEANSPVSSGGKADAPNTRTALAEG